MDQNEPTVEQAVVETEPEVVYGPEPLFSDSEIHNIRAIKLSNGEDILTIIEAINPTVMVVRRPCKILRLPQEDGTAMIVLLKWHTFSAEETAVVQMSSIVSYSKVTPDMMAFFKTSVVKQMIEENESSIPAGAKEFVWPEWMDTEIASKKRSQLN
jgi:hypothetical protein